MTRNQQHYYTFFSDAKFDVERQFKFLLGMLPLLAPRDFVSIARCPHPWLSGFTPLRVKVLTVRHSPGEETHQSRVV
jgi:hypothetical protein